MIIQNHAVHMESNWSLTEHQEKNEHLTAWKGDNRIEILNGERISNAVQGSSLSDSINISDEGMRRFMESARQGSVFAPSMFKGPMFNSAVTASNLGDGENLPTSKLDMMKYLLEKFFGIEIEIINPEECGDCKGGSTKSAKGDQPVQAEGEPERQGWGIDYSYHEINIEKEQLHFEAAGKVTTADGREIQFEAALDMARETVEEISVQFKAGDALIDPLVINYDKKGVQLTDEKYEFDLDADGETENISFVEQGSGFLVLDKNQNGKVDDGSEMFGPETNNGFLELTAYDSDQNGWIDENDSIYYDLRIWTKNETGEDTLSSLKDKNVGAIYLGSARTEFDMSEGQLRESGICLEEDGGVGFIQEVDLKAG